MGRVSGSIARLSTISVTTNPSASCDFAFNISGCRGSTFRDFLRPPSCKRWGAMKRRGIQEENWNGIRQGCNAKKPISVKALSNLSPLYKRGRNWRPPAVNLRSALGERISRESVKLPSVYALPLMSPVSLGSATNVGSLALGSAGGGAQRVLKGDEPILYIICFCERPQI